MSKYRELLRIFINKKNINRLTNENFSIISQNCVGGVMYHDLHMKFLSPTVNLWLYPRDFLKFLENLDYYLGVELKEKHVGSIQYPVGQLDDLTLYLMHYRSFKDALDKWNLRKKRINRDNMFVVMVEFGKPYFDEDCFLRFEKLPYKKIMFTSEPHPEYRDTFCINNTMADDGGVIDILGFKHKLTGKRYLDDFDYVKWLNG